MIRLMQRSGFRRLAQLTLSLCSGLLWASCQSGESSSSPANIIKFDDVFSESMVLQRDTSITFRGEAEAGVRFAIEFAGETKQVEVDENSRWSVSFSPLSAGGPYQIRLDEKEIFSDILIGDVFLCSGQSNMEFPIERALNPDRELGATHPNDIRLLTVPKGTHVLPQNNFTAKESWKIASADSLRDFSAVCYFTARNLKAAADAPIGLIDSSWGGTRIETWMSAQSLRASGERLSDLDLLEIYARDPVEGLHVFGAKWDSWWKNQNKNKPVIWETSDLYEWRPVPGFTNWKDWGVEALENYNGQVWYRSDVALSDAQTQLNKIFLGSIDEMDHVWINGQRIGSQFNWGGERQYAIPPGLLKAGKNEIIVSVHSSWDKGGMFGPANALFLSGDNQQNIPLTEWEYHQADSPGMDAPYAPWESITGITGIHNSMIAPLNDIGAKAVIWYQGESNAGAPDLYGKYLNALIEDFATVLSGNIKTLVIQLPEFGAKADAPTESGWAQLREAQRQVAKNRPDTALVVTLGSGDVYDIHPPNKQEVARRAAIIGKRLLYNDQTAKRQIEPFRAERQGSKVVLTLSHAERGLKTWSSNIAIGFELCDDTSCLYSSGEINHNKVVINIPSNFQPTKLRYNWADVPYGNLSDETGLPVGPFEISVE